MNTARQSNHHAPQSNLTEMYPGVYRPGGDTTADGDDGPNLPTGPLNTLLGFELETYQIPLDQLLPSKKVPDGVMSTRKYKQIVSSINEVGLIEPLSVIQPDRKKPEYLVLDGHLRVLALKELGMSVGPCLFAKDDESYSYSVQRKLVNFMTSRQAKLQEDTYFRVMRILQENPDLTQRELAEKLGISVGGLNYCLKALMEKGLVKMKNFATSKNKFGYVYVLTPTGSFVDSVDRQRCAALVRARFPGKKLVFALGRMTYYKGFDVLIAAARDLDDETVVLLGGKGELLNGLKAQARSLGVDHKVHFLGRVENEELPGYYEAADVFCLPSLMRSEAFGLVMVEAMSYRKPVVATRIPGSGVTWVNVHGETGLNAEPGDPADLARALKQLLNDPHLAKVLGEGGRRRFEQNFTLDKMIGALTQVYSSIGVTGPHR